MQSRVRAEPSATASASVKQEGILLELPWNLEKAVSCQMKQPAPRDHFLRKNISAELLTHVAHSPKWCRGYFQWATSGRVYIWAVDKQRQEMTKRCYPYHETIQSPFVPCFAFRALNHMTNRGLEIVKSKPQKQVLKLEVAFLPIWAGGTKLEPTKDGKGHAVTPSHSIHGCRRSLGKSPRDPFSAANSISIS